MMSAVGQRNTPPELSVREILSSLGRRYRIENRDLPGSPDIANRKRQWAIFVHGCFWHGHKNCPKTKAEDEISVPSSNSEFWRDKLQTNRQRDARAARSLREKGYTVLFVWECQLRDPEAVRDRLDEMIPASGT